MSRSQVCMHVFCRVAVLLAAASNASLAAWAAAVPAFVPALVHPCFQVSSHLLGKFATAIPCAASMCHMPAWI
jgi:hypothetical protein